MNCAAIRIDPTDQGFLELVNPPLKFNLTPRILELSLKRIKSLLLSLVGTFGYFFVFNPHRATPTSHSPITNQLSHHSKDAHPHKHTHTHVYVQTKGLLSSHSPPWIHLTLCIYWTGQLKGASESRDKGPRLDPAPSLPLLCSCSAPSLLHFCFLSLPALFSLCSCCEVCPHEREPPCTRRAVLGKLCKSGLSSFNYL